MIEEKDLLNLRHRLEGNEGELDRQAAQIIKLEKRVSELENDARGILGLFAVIGNPPLRSSGVVTDEAQIKRDAILERLDQRISRRTRFDAEN
jgi:hypothetical protein